SGGQVGLLERGQAPQAQLPGEQQIGEAAVLEMEPGGIAPEFGAFLRREIAADLDHAARPPSAAPWPRRGEPLNPRGGSGRGWSGRTGSGSCRRRRALW